MRLRSLFRRRRVEEDLQREFRFHLDQQIAENRAAGMGPDEARRAALITVGGVTQLQEECRDMRGIGWIDTLIHDLRYGVRTMARNPGFTAVAVATLALGIGANTAIFSLLDAVALRRLPVHNPEQLAEIQWTTVRPAGWSGGSSFTGCDVGPKGTPGGCSFTYAMFDVFRAHTQSFDGVFAFAGPAGLQALIRGKEGGGNIVQAGAALVSGEYFSPLGVPAQLGRLLDAGDDRAGAEAVAVLSSEFWQANFGSDPGVIGQTILLDGAPFTVVGVAPREFFGLQPISMPNLWITIHSGPRLGYGWWATLDEKEYWLSVMGRLRPGVGLDAARAEVEVLFRQNLPNEPRHDAGAAQPGIRVRNAARGLAGMRMQYSQPLQVLMAVVALVMLIACANIANLLLARSEVRRREMAIRMAIGGGRRRLMRQLLTESALLAAAGGVAGLLLGTFASRVLAALLASPLNRSQVDARLSTTVFGFAAALCTLTVVLFGLAPAWTGSQAEPAGALRTGTGAAGGRNRLGRPLVAAEMALALVLLIGAGLFLRTLINLERFDPGFRKDHLLTFGVTRKLDGFRLAPRPNLNAELQARLAALPGVVSATWASDLLLVGNLYTPTIRIEGLGEQKVQGLSVGSRFFETLAIPLLAGRNIAPEDCRRYPDVAWVNRALAQRYFGNQDPVGKRISRGAQNYQIVGIVGDVRFQTLRSEIAPTVYMPASGGGTFLLRTTGDPMKLAAAVPRVVAELAPEEMVLSLRSEEAKVDTQLFTEHMMARLSVVFGLMALVLASIGIYGVLAYSVTRRTSEIAIRASLGALPREIASMILADGLRPAAVGAAAGLAASFALTRFIGTFLFGISPLDWRTFAWATVVLLGVAAAACYLPARRATRMEPMAALRQE